MNIIFTGHGILFIAIAVVARFIIGAIWYSPILFLKPWMKAQGKTMAECKPNGGGAKSMGISFLFSIVSTLILALFAVNPVMHSVVLGIVVAVLIWIGFVLPMHVNHHIFSIGEKKPLSFLLINAGQDLVSLVVAAVILTFI